MSLRSTAALLFLVLAGCALHGQDPRLPLCIVQIKPDLATQYDPSAGPWAIAMYNQLSRQTLSNGAPLKITVMAASVEREVLPEARRLQCAWSLQIWLQQMPEWGADWDRFHQTLFFALRNSGTGKVVASGAAPLRSSEPWVTVIDNDPDAQAMPCAGLAKQILARFNQLR